LEGSSRIVSKKDVTKYDHEYPSSDEECKRIAEYFSKGEGFWTVCLKNTGKNDRAYCSKSKGTQRILDVAYWVCFLILYTTIKDMLLNLVGVF